MNKQHLISHVLYWTIIYLRLHARQITSVRYCRFPYHYLGFSLMGFITFHSIISNRLVSLTLLQAISIVALRKIASRQLALPKLTFSLGIITTSVAGCASMDFPLPKQRLSECYLL